MKTPDTWLWWAKWDADYHVIHRANSPVLSAYLDSLDPAAFRRSEEESAKEYARHLSHVYNCTDARN